MLSPAGLPNRPWYRHTIYAPGEYTGYAAVVIPGVNEAIEAKDSNRARQQLAVLAQALDRAAQTLARSALGKQAALVGIRLRILSESSLGQLCDQRSLDKWFDPLTRLSAPVSLSSRYEDLFQFNGGSGSR